MADTSHIPDLLLERYVLGELSEKERESIDARIKNSPSAQQRLAELRESNARFLDSHPAEAALAKIEARRRQRQAAEEQAPSRRRLFSIALPLTSALAAAAVLVVLLRPTPPVPESTNPDELQSPDGLRTKGLRPHLVIFSKPQLGQEPKQLKEGESVRAHEVLQLGYVGAGRAHGVVVSIDGRGSATLHFPTSAEQSSRLGSGQVLLPSAYELDDAPHFERFLFVTSATPVDVAQILAAAQALAKDPAQAKTAALSLKAGLEQSSLLLLKTENGGGP